MIFNKVNTSNIKMLILLIMVICIDGFNAVIYDCYSGKPASLRQLQLFKERNNERYCLIDVKPCNESEWRRVDGSCNNLKWPSRGMMRTPSVKFIPSVFSKDYDPRNAKNGGALPLERFVRTQMLMTGQAHGSITMLVSYVLLSAINDLNSLHDVLNFVGNTTNCCTPEGKSNYICAPNKIPDDDPIHRYSGIRCQSHTRPQSFQYFGCVDFGTTPFARISFVTSVFDLSTVYGSDTDTMNKLRTFCRGLLKTEIEDGKIFPPKDPNIYNNICAQNQLPRETRCHKYQVNGGLGPNIIMILFYRYHNYIAKELAKLNPCWDDDRLFYTARDINVATFYQIYFYELLPIILGRNNLIRDGVISCTGDFRDLYENKPPQVFDEFIYINRWFHTIQETDLKLYDEHGCFLKTFPITNLTARTGHLSIDDNLKKIFQSCFMQRGAKFDQCITHDMSERAVGGVLFTCDAATGDIAMGRFLGIQPYAKYRQFCTKRHYKTFNCFEDAISKERIYRLKEVFDHPDDLDLLAGTYAEKRIPGGLVPHTVYCLMVKQLQQILASDRHWYERPNRPHAFTFRQLQAVRKVTIAGVFCTCADGVTKIQPKAFLQISPGNPLIDCRSCTIGKLDLSPWKDLNCK